MLEINENVVECINISNICQKKVIRNVLHTIKEHMLLFYPPPLTIKRSKPLRGQPENKKLMSNVSRTSTLFSVRNVKCGSSLLHKLVGMYADKPMAHGPWLTADTVTPVYPLANLCLQGYKNNKL